ncbi:MAG: branched-chain amino acid transaminase [bacterium]|nr:branched-chain amino acid transaminase [bacterium]
MAKDYLPKAYIRGEFVDHKDANISISTNALQYGVAIFGGVKGYRVDGKTGIFRLDDHIERIRQSAKILRFTYNFDAKHIKDTFIELTKRNKPKGNCYYRPFIYRSDLDLGPGITGEYDFALYMLNLDDYFDSSKGLKITTSSWMRNPDNSIPPRTKASGGYVNAALAMHDAKQDGYDAAIMLDSSGHIGEGAVMNFFMVRNGKIITPQVNSDILEGITRRTVLEQAKRLGIPMQERQVDRSELYIADEVFFSGTATEMTWATSIDKVKVTDKPGPIFTKLRARFDELTSKPNDHLTFI